MNWFVLIGGILLLVVLALLIVPLLRRDSASEKSAAELRELNLGIFREQLNELERDLRSGHIDQSAYEQGRQELERRVLEDSPVEQVKPVSGGRKTKLALLLAGGVPAAVFGLYMMLGAPEAMTGKPSNKGGGQGEHALSPEQISSMVERLALRLQDNPDDGQGWLMLARSYAVLGRYPESAAAFGRAVTLLPPDAQHYADFADIVAMAQGKALAGEPEKLVRRALQIDPNNLKALALSGTIAFDKQNYQAAISEWRKVLALVPPDSSVSAGISGSIADAENRLAIAGKQKVTAAVSGAGDAAPPIRVNGVVELDPKLKGKVASGDVLFVYARAVNGPKMPVAMIKKTVADLPFSFTLDDSMSMAPQFKLSTAGQVIVGARISKSGDALPRPGDIEGLSAPVSPGGESVRIRIQNRVE